MKTRRAILAAIVVLGIIFILGQTQAMSYFLSGNELVKYMREYEKADNDQTKSYGEAGLYVGFIMGVWDMNYPLHLVLESLRPDPPKFDPPKGVTGIQAVAIVTKYLKAHPEGWAEPAWVLVIGALSEAFPKKK